MIGNRDRRYLNKGVLLFEGTHMKKKKSIRTNILGQSILFPFGDHPYMSLFGRPQLYVKYEAQAVAMKNLNNCGHNHPHESTLVFCCCGEAE